MTDVNLARRSPGPRKRVEKGKKGSNPNELMLIDVLFYNLESH